MRRDIETSTGIQATIKTYERDSGELLVLLAIDEEVYALTFDDAARIGEALRQAALEARSKNC